MKNGRWLIATKAKLYRLSGYFSNSIYTRTVYSLVLITAIVLVFVISGTSKPVSSKNINVTNNTAKTAKVLKSEKPLNISSDTSVNAASAGTLKAQSSATASTIQTNTTHPQPPIDTAKVPASKVTAPLDISPSSITVYKNITGAVGVKADATQTSVTISDAAGKALEYPNTDTSSGVTLTASTFGSSVNWSMIATAEYATAGSIVNVPITATASDGSVTYTGTLIVNVVAMPTFSISASQLNAVGPPDSTNFSCGVINPISYSSGFSASYTPTISLSNLDGYGFSYQGFANNEFNVSSTYPIYYGQSVLVNILIQNQFQLITIPCLISPN
jgi:hypothetical protein